jgi:S-(hydroxymethyl)glutathione dehydrogenase/alcohol dehydrogenase
MRAAVLRGPGLLAVEEVAVEEPRAGEVLVRMHAAGVCGSDVHVIRGTFPAPLPVVPGHEGAGVVEAVGPGVTHVRPGDHVMLLWRTACGGCWYCAHHRPALCEQGQSMRFSGLLPDGTTRYLDAAGATLHHFAGISTFAEWSVAPAAAVLPIPEDVPFAAAAVVGCAVLTGTGAVFNAAQVRPGQSCAVLGCGGVGLNVIQACAISGASLVVAIDVDPEKLRLAGEFGATHLVDARDGGALETVQSLTGGLGAEVAFEASGRIEALQEAVSLVRRAGTVIAVGAPPFGAHLQLEALPFVMSDKTLRGTLYGSADFGIDVPRLIDLYRAGKLKLDELITREFALDEIGEAVAAAEQGRVARAAVRLA